ncbi:IS3 family transposase [uncultured Brevibacillus sp.]
MIWTIRSVRRSRIVDCIMYYNSGRYQWSLTKMTPDE